MSDPPASHPAPSLVPPAPADLPRPPLTLEALAQLVESRFGLLQTEMRQRAQPSRQTHRVRSGPDFDEPESDFAEEEKAEHKQPPGRTDVLTEEEHQADLARQRRLAKHSRQSVSNLAQAAVVAQFSFSDGDSLVTPLRRTPAKLTRSLRRRRLSQGHPSALDTEDEDDSDVDEPAQVAALPVALPFDTSNWGKRQLLRLSQAAKFVGDSVTKFHGSPVKDGERTVHEFVKLINSQLDMWMGSDQLGRLSLVIGCTDGIAQNWLVNKRDELAKLRAAGHITDPLVSEWVEVQQQFITEMSKGVTPALYEQQLRDLRLKDDDGKLDPSAFIRRFNEITTRLYPPGSWAIESDRSRMLATIFDDRVQTGGDIVLWEKMQEWLWSKGQPKGMRQLDVCQKALLEAWGLLQVTRDGRNRSYGGARRNPWQRDEKKKALPLPPSSASTSHHANAVAARTNDLLLGANDDSSQSENGQLGTQELAAVAQAGRGRREGRGGRNPHLSPALVEQLRNNGLCLSCYKPGHYSRQCTATQANRPPNSDELKVKAGQK